MPDPFAHPGGDSGTEFTAGFDGHCDACGAHIAEGETMYAQGGQYICDECHAEWREWT
jgi:hypothetical protein